MTFIIFRYSFFFKGSKIIISFFKFVYIFSFFTANEAGIVQFVKRPGAILENGSIIGKELCLKEIGPVPYKLFKNLVKLFFCLFWLLFWTTKLDKNVTWRVFRKYSQYWIELYYNQIILIFFPYSQVSPGWSSPSLSGSKIPR